MVGTIHIHEDDWGLRNLYPLAAEAGATADLARADAFGVEHRDSTGFGWNDIYVIQPPSLDYADTGLRLADVVEHLLTVMPRVRHFNATASAGFASDTRDAFGSYETDAWCFGLDQCCFIKLEPRDELVERVWFDITASDADCVRRLRAAFAIIDTLVPSMIADYPMHLAGPIGDPTFLDAYFAAHAEHEKDVRRRMEEMRNAPHLPPRVPYPRRDLED